MSDINDLLASIDIEDFLETEGITYRKGASGQYQLQECPWCGDSRFKVYMRCDDGRGLCYHGECGQKFNLWGFARQHWGSSNQATFMHFERYAKGAGIITSAPVAAPASVETSGWQMPSSVSIPTPEGHSLDYLINRKITKETQSLFGLRYCHEGHYSYVDASGQERQTDFSQRIILPVTDLDGEVKTFQGRDISGTAEKRYLFPSMLPGTGRFFYGGHLAQGKSHLVICEGPFDVFAAHQSIEGLPEFRETGVIGSFGLSIGRGHETGDDQLGRLRILKRAGLRTLTFLWDGEAGALKQALAAGKLLRDEGFIVRIGLLPQGKDPNEVSTECVRQTLRQARMLDDSTLFELMFRTPYR